MKALAERIGVTWGAIAQLSLGAPTVKPTRLLTNIPKVKELLYEGPPNFAGNGAYLGPLPFMTAPSGPLIGKVKNEFRTHEAAAWPPRMCAEIADAIMDGIDLEAHRARDDTINILYLFSGKRRQGSVRDRLEKRAEAERVKIDVMDLDLLHGADLLNKRGQRQLRTQVSSGGFAAVIASPPMQHIFESEMVKWPGAEAPQISGPPAWVRASEHGAPQVGGGGE